MSTTTESVSHPIEDKDKLEVIDASKSSKKRRKLGGKDISFRTSVVTNELRKRLRRLTMQQTTARLKLEEIEFYIDLTKREVMRSYQEDAAYKRRKGDDDDDGGVPESIYDDIIANHFMCESEQGDVGPTVFE